MGVFYLSIQKIYLMVYKLFSIHRGNYKCYFLFTHGNFLLLHITHFIENVVSLAYKDNIGMAWKHGETIGVSCWLKRNLRSWRDNSRGKAEFTRNFYCVLTFTQVARSVIFLYLNYELL